MTDIPGHATDARAAWEKKLQQAHALMAARRGRPSALIEVAAQHPLVDGIRPNEEFEARLNRAHELYNQLTTDGLNVELYVPGSRHMFQGTADKISLSQAGSDYLTARGIPAACIHGEDLNHRYKGDDGVYNSADECFVTASHFKNGDFGTLLTVLAPGQLHRKMLHYIQFGVLPLPHTAPAPVSFHNYVHEAFVELPHVLLEDPDLQSPDSAKANRLRRERRPGPVD
ncbi:hypothetical protein E4N62_36825 [Streptomyces sp. MNU76]|uniref:hypothetical protein n=1 Tax=Streptomyces sp. MNU76 TaxID=2560026 RepID=UPI001E4910F8|nr:hypothetical protein [Streptomyces sp. MNU76]MCC9710334.1 hypothetical protein [Streptomyces sp. MNU76]